MARREERMCIRNSPSVLHLSSLRITKGYIQHTASGEPWYTKDSTSGLKWPVEHTVTVPSENPTSMKLPTDAVRTRQKTTAIFFVTGSRCVGGNLQTWEGRGTDYVVVKVKLRPGLARKSTTEAQIPPDSTHRWALPFLQPGKSRQLILQGSWGWGSWMRWVCCQRKVICDQRRVTDLVFHSALGSSLP